MMVLEIPIDRPDWHATEPKAFTEREWLDRVQPASRLPKPIRQDDRVVELRCVFWTRGDEAGIESALA
jgi:hypothetical protein